MRGLVDMFRFAGLEHFIAFTDSTDAERAGQDQCNDDSKNTGGTHEMAGNIIIRPMHFNARKA